MRTIHWPLIVPVLLLTVSSLLILSSIAERFFLFQLLWIILGAGFLTFFHFFDWRPFINYRWVIIGVYAVLILLLLATYIFAPTIRGVRAWIVVGPFQVQTSEFAKAGLILVLAYFFGRHHLMIGQARVIGYSFALVALPIGLVLLQPDLGSAIVMGALWFCFLLLSGLRTRHFFIAVLTATIGFFLAWNFFLAGYQKDRIIGLFNPDRDPLGVNYSVIQSKIAIGSAGFWGKGYGQGTQTQLGFLPEANADFIFAAFVEEWGIALGLFLIAVFVYLIFHILKAGSLAETNFEKFICLGTVAVLSLHFAINVGSTIGFFPVVGVPLPFVSYGGSNLLTNFFLIGIVHSIAGRSV